MKKCGKNLLSLAVFSVSIFIAENVFGCYSAIIGKKASADSSILVSHDEQDGLNRFINFRKVPR